MDTASPMLPTSEESIDFSACELDNTALTQLISFQKKNNPRLKDWTNRDIAEACGMSENTLCAILKGKNRNPRVATLACILRIIGGGSIDRLVGLAPHRDFAKEEAVYDATLVEAMQARLDEKRMRIEELTVEVSEAEAECTRLRKMYNEKCMEASAANARMESMKAEAKEGAARHARRDETEKRHCQDIDELKKTLYAERAEARKMRMLGILACIGLVVALAVIVYLLWEIANPTLGKLRY